jgi:hypothetical protein
LLLDARTIDKTKESKIRRNGCRAGLAAQFNFLVKTNLLKETKSKTSTKNSKKKNLE